MLMICGEGALELPARPTLFQLELKNIRAKSLGSYFPPLSLDIDKLLSLYFEMISWDGLLLGHDELFIGVNAVVLRPPIRFHHLLPLSPSSPPKTLSHSSPKSPLPS